MFDKKLFDNINTKTFISPMTTLGDTIYGGAAGIGTRLAGNTTTTKQFLSQTGTGTESVAPVWGALASSDIPSLDVSKITSGTLGVARGGTGASTFSTNYLPKYNGTNLVNSQIYDNGTNVGISDGSTSLLFRSGYKFTVATSGWTTIDTQPGTGGVAFWDDMSINGNLGLGTESPTEKLQIYNGGMVILNDSSSTKNIGINIGSGFTSPSGDITGINHVVYKTNTGNVYGYKSSVVLSASYTSAICYDYYATHSTSYGTHYAFYSDNSTAKCYRGGTTTWDTTSDIRLKENIQLINNALESILNLRGVYFNWKNIEKNKGKATTQQIGVIAQELEAVYPSLVNEEEDGYKMVHDITGFDAVLIEAIKEQQKQIEELKIEITNLKNN